MRSRFIVLALLSSLLGCSSGEGAGSAAAGSGNGNTSGGDAGGAGNGGNQSQGGRAGSTLSEAGKSSGSGGTTTSNGGNASPGGAGATSGGSASSGGGASGPIDCRAAGDGKSTITFINHCQGTLSFRGSKIEGGDLAPGEHACRDVGDAKTSIPAIRFWGFVGEDPGPERYTLAELTLNTTFNDFDWYNISHVDASNLPMSLAAVDMPKCRTLSCPTSLLPNCPAVGQEKDKSGNVISCFSPDRNNPNSPVAQYFEMSCKDAYSWSGDDQDSVVACAGEDYDITFCP